MCRCNPIPYNPLIRFKKLKKRTVPLYIFIACHACFPVILRLTPHPVIRKSVFFKREYELTSQNMDEHPGTGASFYAEQRCDLS
jgi:hypothetical protein